MRKLRVARAKSRGRGAPSMRPSTATSASAFRAAEKRFKRDGQRPNRGLTEEQLADLLDPDECVPPATTHRSAAHHAVPDFFSDGRISPPRSARCAAQFEAVSVDAAAPEWLRAAEVWALRGVDGFRLIRCPFPADAQLQLVSSALSEHTLRHSPMVTAGFSMWQTWLTCNTNLTASQLENFSKRPR